MNRKQSGDAAAKEPILRSYDATTETWFCDGGCHIGDERGQRVCPESEQWPGAGSGAGQIRPRADAGTDDDPHQKAAWGDGGWGEGPRTQGGQGHDPSGRIARRGWVLWVFGRVRGRGGAVGAAWP